MTKYSVYGIATGSKYIGEYEADSKEEAINKMLDDNQADSYISLCHQCSNEIEVGDCYEFQAEEA